MQGDALNEPQVRWLTVAGCRVHVMQAGTGAPLLFLHGGRGAGEWLPFFAALARRFQLIVPEHPGFGRSDTPAWLENVGDLAHFYQSFIRMLGLSKVHLVGTSLGGWIAAELAMRDGQALQALTLIAAAGIPVRGEQPQDLFLWTPEQMLRHSYADPARVEQLLVAQPDDAERNLQQKNRQTLARLGRATYMCDPHLHERLPHLAIPTQLIWGERDGIIPPSHGRAYQAAIPAAQLHLLSDCGHLPHVEKLDDTVALVCAFDDRLRG